MATQVACAPVACAPVACAPYYYGTPLGYACAVLLLHAAISTPWYYINYVISK